MNVIGKEVTKITSIWDAVGVIADALGQSWLNYTDQLPRPIDENDFGFDQFLLDVDKKSLDPLP